MASRPEEFPHYTGIDRRTLNAMLEKLRRYLSDFSLRAGIKDIAAFETTIEEVFERVDKRRVYFYIFYQGCVMGEVNEVALMCFWIVKLCPFFSSGVPSDIVNAKIAVSLFFKMVRDVALTLGKKVCITPRIVRDLFYAFRFRDISKESLMLLAESLIQAPAS
jgi:hypothetical protein